MSITAYDRRRTKNWDSYRFNFNTFKSSEDFLQEVIDINESKDYRFRSNTDYSIYFQQEKYQEATTYADIDGLNSLMDGFDELYDQIDMGGAFKKQKLLITDDKRGIFSFSIASKGLYRGVEYFSEQIFEVLEAKFGIFPMELELKKCDVPIPAFNGVVSVKRSRNQFKSPE